MPCIKCGKLIQLIYNKKEYNHSGLCRKCFHEQFNRNKIDLWLKTGDTGCQVSSTLKNCIRDYIFQDQNNRCAICGIKNEWNGKNMNFILDHINGDASNNQKENLRLICPNCDSQLDTYKSKNKNSARTHRKI